MLYKDRQGRLYAGVPTPYGMHYIPLLQSGAQSRGMGNLLTQPRGMGDVASNTTYVVWKAPATIGLFSSTDWTTKSAVLGNLIAQKGWQTIQVTYDWHSYVPPSYDLIIKAMLPAGIDGAESILADLADAAGFNVDRTAIGFNAGGTPSPGDGSNPDPNKKPTTDYTPMLIAGGLLAVVILLKR